MRLHFARDALLSARGLTRVTYVRQEPGKSRRKCGVLARTRSERETKFLCVRFCPVVPRPAWGRAALSRRGTGVARRGAADLHHQRSARRHARALSFQIPMQSSSSSGLAGSSALAVGHMAAAWQHTTTSALVEVWVVWYSPPSWTPSETRRACCFRVSWHAHAHSWRRSPRGTPWRGCHRSPLTVRAC